MMMISLASLAFCSIGMGSDALANKEKVLADLAEFTATHQRDLERYILLKETAGKNMNFVQDAAILHGAVEVLIASESAIVNEFEDLAKKVSTETDLEAVAKTAKALDEALKNRSVLSCTALTSFIGKNPSEPVIATLGIIKPHRLSQELIDEYTSVGRENMIYQLLTGHTETLQSPTLKDISDNTVWLVRLSLHRIFRSESKTRPNEPLR